MTINKRLFYLLLAVALAALMMLTGWAGYMLFNRVLGPGPSATSAPAVVTVVIVATPTQPIPSATPTPLAAATLPAGATATAPASITAAAPTATPAPALNVLVAADLANLRSAPDISAPVLGAAPRGALLQPQGRTADNQWLLVCCVYNQWGWIANHPDLVTLNFQPGMLPVVQFPTPAPLPTRTPFPTWTPVPQPTRTPTATPMPTPTSVPQPTRTPTVTALPPTATPTPPTDFWRGDYFNNLTLQGSPVLTRHDAAITFNWGMESPAPGVVSTDNFSVRWTRWLVFPHSDTVRFTARVDDGVRVKLDGAVILDGWRDSAQADYAVERPVQAGTHLIEVEYYERGGQAEITFGWMSLTASPTASSTPTSTATPTATVTGTRTPTATPTATVTGTSTSTATPSPTGTRTPTSTTTATVTGSPTSTATPTVTTTPTIVMPPSEPTASSTPAATATSTSTPTPVATNTATPTAAATATHTHTPTPAPSTATPTATSEPAATSSPTVTPLPSTPTSTPTPALPPSLVISPTMGWAGTVVQVTGANWLPNERVTVTVTQPRSRGLEFTRARLRVRTDQQGRFTTTLTMPPQVAQPGATAVWIVGTGSTNLRATAVFTLMPPSEPTPVTTPTLLPPTPVSTPPPDSNP